MHLPDRTIEQLLADESFINYCKGDEVHSGYWENYLRENPEQKEKAVKARQLFLGIFNALAASDLEEQAEILRTKIEDASGATVISMSFLQKKTRPYSFAIKIAAALLLIVGGYFAWVSMQAEPDPLLLTYTTLPGEKKTIQLADGSVIMLNASSKISITDKFGLSDRSVKLVGEAYFDVKKNKALPFIVSTRTMQVKALGTAFNIKAYPGDTKCETALIRGVIEVTLNDKSDTRLMLYPNQKVQWKNAEEIKNQLTIKDTSSHSYAQISPVIGSLSPMEEGSVKELAWTENKLIFLGETFLEIAPQLERWYGITIEFQDEVVTGYRFTATFEKESLQTILDVLKESKGFNYQIVKSDKKILKISR